MSDGALRGTRLGAASYETDENVVFAPRQTIFYDCPNGHELIIPMATEAEIPYVWNCHCGADAIQRNGEKPDEKPVKPARTHWDMLRERRSIEELEAILVERLEQLRGERVSVKVLRQSA